MDYNKFYDLGQHLAPLTMEQAETKIVHTVGDNTSKNKKSDWDKLNDHSLLEKAMLGTARILGISDTIVDDEGRTYQANNHNLNDDTAKMAKAKFVLSVEKNRTNDKGVRMLYQGNYEDSFGNKMLKVGTAKNKQRYMDDPLFNQNTEFNLFDSVKGADKIEADFHGAKGIRSKSVADYGKAGATGFSGATELYKGAKINFKRTDFNTASLLEAKSLLNDKQKEIASNLTYRGMQYGENHVDYVSKRTKFNSRKHEIQNDLILKKLEKTDFNTLSLDDTVKLVQLKDEKSFFWGAGSEHKLLSQPNVLKAMSNAMLKSSVIDVSHYDTLSTEDKVKVAKDWASGEINNSVKFAVSLAKLKGQDRKDYLQSLAVYSASNPNLRQFVSSLGESAIDPTTYLSAGVGKIVAKKLALKKGLNMGISASIGTIEGGKFGMMEGHKEDELASFNGHNTHHMGVVLGGITGAVVGAGISVAGQQVFAKLADAKIGESLTPSQKATDEELVDAVLNLSVDDKVKIVKHAKVPFAVGFDEKKIIDMTSQDAKPEWKKTAQKHLNDLILENFDAIKGERKVPTRHAGLSADEKQATIVLESVLTKITDPQSKSVAGKARKILTQLNFKGDSRRMYDNNHAISEKAGKQVSAQISEIVYNKKTPYKKKMEDLLKAYDDNEKLRSVYGTGKTSYDGLDYRPTFAKKAHRMEFVVDQYTRILESGEFKKSELVPIMKEYKKAKTKLASLKVYKNPSDIKMIAKEEYYSQKGIRLPKPHDADIESYTKEMSKQFKVYKDRQSDKYKQNISFDGDKVLRGVERNAMVNRDKANIASETLRQKSGRRWDDGIPLAEHERHSKADARVMKRQWARERNIEDYKNHKIEAEELFFREQKMIKEEVDFINKKTFKDAGEKEQYINEVNSMAEAIGSKQLLRALEKKTKKESKAIKRENYTPPPVEKTENIDTKKINAERASMLKKLEWHKKGFEQRAMGGPNVGQKTIDARLSSMVDEGVLPNERIVELLHPMVKPSLYEEQLAINKTILAREYSQALAHKHGVKISNFSTTVIPKRTSIDASNSYGQILGVVTKSENLKRKTRILEDADYRDDVVNRISHLSGERFGDVDKELVKSVLMPHGYGQGHEGAVNVLMKTRGYDRDTATEMVGHIFSALGDSVPELKEFVDTIRKAIKEGKLDAVTEFETFGGTMVSVDMKAQKIETYKQGGKRITLAHFTDDLDRFSSAIMPAIIHSIDAGVAKKMAIRGKFRSTHDSFHAQTKGREAEIFKHYDHIMNQLSSDNVLERVGEAMTGDKNMFKVGTNTKIGKSKETNALQKELQKGVPYEVSSKEKSGVIHSLPDMMEQKIVENDVFKLSYRGTIHKYATDAGYRELNKNSTSLAERIAFKAMNQSEFTKKDLAMGEKNWSKEARMAFYDRQKEMFLDMRAKMEMNPLVDTKGEILFNKKRNTKRYTEILDREFQAFEDSIINLPPEVTKQIRETKYEVLREWADQYVKTGVPLKDYKKAVGKKKYVTKRYAKGIDNRQSDQIVRFLYQSRVPKTKVEKLTLADSIKSTYDYTGANKDFNTLMRTKSLTEQRLKEKEKAFRDDFSNQLLKDKIDEKEFNEHVLKSGYHLLEGMDRETAKRLFNKNRELYTLASKYIEQSAKAMGNKSEEYGYFRANSDDIVRELNLDANPETSRLLDIMIAYRSMNKHWDYIDKVKGTKSFKDAMQVMQHQGERSKRLFSRNTQNLNRGYLQEVYTDVYNIDGTFKTENRFESGLIAGVKKGRVGKEVDIELPKGLSATEMKEFLQKNKLKFSGGKLRKAVSIEQKLRTGLELDASKTLARTVYSIDKKFAENRLNKNFKKFLNSPNDLVSKEEKKGWIKLEDDVRMRLPIELRDMKSINPKFSEKILGREEVRLYSKEANRALMFADRLASDFAVEMKKNVVLRSLSSLKNSYLVNAFTNLAYGKGFVHTYKVHSKTFKEMKEYKRLVRLISRRKAKGLKTKKLVEKLSKLDVYKYASEGMSFGSADGVIQDSVLLSGGLSNITPNWMSKAWSQATLRDGTIVGDKMTEAFHLSDTAGRIGMAKIFEERGLTRKEAVFRANNLYGDADAMAHPFIEVLDKYPVMPFLKWFTRVAPQMMKTFKDEPVLGLGVAGLIYMTSMEADKNFDSASNLATLLDYPEMLVTKPWDTYEQIEKDGKLKVARDMAMPYILPDVYIRQLKQFETGKIAPTKLFLPRRPDKEWYLQGLIANDPRGATQKIVEGLTDG